MAIGETIKPKITLELYIARETAVHQETPEWLHAWKPWLIVTIVLSALSYGPPLADLIRKRQSIVSRPTGLVKAMKRVPIQIGVGNFASSDSTLNLKHGTLNYEYDNR